MVEEEYVIQNNSEMITTQLSYSVLPLTIGVLYKSQLNKLSLLPPHCLQLHTTLVL